MKRGDLVKIFPRVYHSIPRGGKHVLGIWLGSRYTKWSTEHQFHTILFPDLGVMELCINPMDLTVIQ